MIEHALYIACVDLRGKTCLVVGAGPIALEKIEGLLACKARVRVVAVHAIQPVQDLVKTGAVEWRPRRFERDDLDGCFIAVAATSDNEVNRAVFEAAEARSMLVNVVDTPELCNFIFPAILRREPLAVAISTSGASPALAKRLKREIAYVIGEHHARLAALLDAERDWAKSNLPTYDDRKRFFESIVEADPDPIGLLRQGDDAAVVELIAAAKERATAEVAP